MTKKMYKIRLSEVNMAKIELSVYKHRLKDHIPDDPSLSVEGHNKYYDRAQFFSCNGWLAIYRCGCKNQRNTFIRLWNGWIKWWDEEYMPPLLQNLATLFQSLAIDYKYQYLRQNRKCHNYLADTTNSSSSAVKSANQIVKPFLSKHSTIHHSE